MPTLADSAAIGKAKTFKVRIAARLHVASSNWSGTNSFMSPSQYAIPTQTLAKATKQPAKSNAVIIQAGACQSRQIGAPTPTASTPPKQANRMGNDPNTSLQPQRRLAIQDESRLSIKG